jgi:predicted DsbA family dithiol-disulfide isomerase
VQVTLYTDPGCPFGFNAQRQELQLAWHYPDAEVRRTMIVLGETTRTVDELPFPVEVLVATRERLAAEYGMPMWLGTPTVFPATIDACRAYVGARRDAPERALALLRALRVRAQSENQPLDAPETLHGAAADAGLDPAQVDAWLTDAGVEADLRADMADTRNPLPEALALKHKLSRDGDNYRYSTSSAVFEHNGRRVVAAGFQPFAVYEVAAASVAPELERRPAPGSVEAILEWAPFPLATAEIAELRGITRDQARTELERAGATFTPSANDGYWS